MDFVYTLSHFLFPRQSNNHRAKLLHSSTLLVVVVFLVLYQVILQVMPITGIRILGYGANISPTEVFNLTNSKRVESGLAALEYNSFLESAARAKGEDMLVKDYWAHVSPDGIQPWKFFIDSGYKYRFAGENLARDFSDPNSAVEAWMASTSHRENILSAKYQEIGVAVVEGDLAGVDTTIVVQFFGTRYVDTTPQVPIAMAEAVMSEPTPTPTPITTKVEEETVVGEQAVVAPAEGVSSTGPKFTFSPFDSTQGISLAIIILLLAVLVVDGLLVSRRRITRIGGRTFAHLAFLGMVLAIVVIAKAGQIL